MKRLIKFSKAFTICFISSIVVWLIFGGILSLYIPSFKIAETFSYGIGTGILTGIIGGIWD